MGLSRKGSSVQAAAVSVDLLCFICCNLLKCPTSEPGMYIWVYSEFNESSYSETVEVRPPQNVWLSLKTGSVLYICLSLPCSLIFRFHGSLFLFLGLFYA